MSLPNVVSKVSFHAFLLCTSDPDFLPPSLSQWDEIENRERSNSLLARIALNGDKAGLDGVDKRRADAIILQASLVGVLSLCFSVQR